MIAQCNLRDDTQSYRWRWLHGNDRWCKRQFVPVENILVDCGYSGENFAKKVTDMIWASVEVAKHIELHKFAVIPKRWLVERSFGWLEKCWRLWKNCERKISTSYRCLFLLKRLWTGSNKFIKRFKTILYDKKLLGIGSG